MLAELSRREKNANIKPDPDLVIFMKAVATKGQESNVVTDYVLKVYLTSGQQHHLIELLSYLSSSQRLERMLYLTSYSPIDGYIVYQGPRENVLEFFETMDFKCRERKGMADFLQEVICGYVKKRSEAVHRDKPYRFITAKEFYEAYQSCHVGLRLSDELAKPNDKSKSHPAALTTDRTLILAMNYGGFALLVLLALSGFVLARALGKSQPVIPDKVDNDKTTELSPRETTAEASQHKKKGMVLSFEPYAITFDDIKDSVDKPLTLEEQRCLHYPSTRRNKALIAQLGVPSPGAKELSFTFINQCLACLWKQYAHTGKTHHML
ncbi:hypothetical protein ACET3Z_017018 [Daucus carota]